MFHSTRRSRRVLVIGSALLMAIPLLLLVGEAAAAPPPADTFHGLTPARLMETRPGFLTIDHLFEGGGPVGPGSVTNMATLGRGGLPAGGVGAVALNVTGIAPTVNTFLTVWPTGATQPTTSNLNLRVGVPAMPNMVIVPLGTGGQISLFNANGSTGLIIDVLGWFPEGASFTGLVPARLMETRPGFLTIDHLFEGGGPVGPGSVTNMATLGRGGLPAGGVGAVALNVTGIAPTVNTFLTVWPTGATQPTTSNLNLQAGVPATPNMVIVPLGTGGQISLFNANGSTGLIIDVLGWFPEGASFTGLVPARLMETRPGFLTIDHLFEGGGPVGPGSVTNLTMLNRGGVPASGVGAVALNVTGIAPTVNTFMTVWPTGATQPNASNLNLRVGVPAQPNMVIVPLGTGGQISLFNANGNTNLIVDVLGWFPETTVSPSTFRASQETGGTTPVGGTSTEAAVSGDGRFTVFTSNATNLVADDTNFAADVFLHDRATGITLRVSGASGAEANGPSTAPAISASGQWISYASSADNLVGGDTNGLRDIFLWDRLSNLTTRVNVGPSGIQADIGHSDNPTVSGDGRYVSYESGANNLVAGDTNLMTDIFLYDRQLGETLRINLADDLSEALGGGSHFPSISNDGRYVSYHSFANNLLGAGNDNNLKSDVFVYDRIPGTTIRVSESSAGVEGNGEGYYSAISGNGRFITFHSLSTNLVTGDTNVDYDVFLHDRILGSTTRVSVDSAGNEVFGGSSYYGGISGDGRYVTFYSYSDDPVSDDTNGKIDVFVRDTLMNTTTRVSVDTTGTDSNGDSFAPDISDNGRYIAFESSATDLIAVDGNVLTDVIVRDMGTI